MTSHTMMSSRSVAVHALVRCRRALPQASRRRARIGGNAAEAVGELLHHLFERGALADEREEKLDEMHGDKKRPGTRRALDVTGYFAAFGKAGSLPMSRGSCWMMTVAFRFDAI